MRSLMAKPNPVSGIGDIAIPVYPGWESAYLIKENKLAAASLVSPLGLKLMLASFTSQKKKKNSPSIGASALIRI